MGENKGVSHFVRGGCGFPHLIPISTIFCVEMVPLEESLTTIGSCSLVARSVTSFERIRTANHANDTNWMGAMVRCVLLPRVTLPWPLPGREGDFESPSKAPTRPADGHSNY